MNLRANPVIQKFSAYQSEVEILVPGVLVRLQLTVKRPPRELQHSGLA